jgi:hypothetical protein
MRDVVAAGVGRLGIPARLVPDLLTSTANGRRATFNRRRAAAPISATQLQISAMSGRLR